MTGISDYESFIETVTLDNTELGLKRGNTTESSWQVSFSGFTTRVNRGLLSGKFDKVWKSGHFIKLNAAAKKRLNIIALEKIVYKKIKLI